VWWGKKFILVTTLIVAVLSAGTQGISCSSSGDESEELPDTPQDAGPLEGMPPGPGLSDDLLARVAEILGIDQEQVADAFEQAQSEMMEGMPGDGQPLGATPPEGMPPEDMSPEDMPSGGMPPGLGLADDLLARVAEILGIDQQDLADAVKQAQSEMTDEIAPPSPNQQ
jgi:uncharacterized protein (DUF2126 family)